MFGLGVRPSVDEEAAEEGSKPVEAEGEEHVGQDEEFWRTDGFVLFVEDEAEEQV